jgi:TetR/AcrR family transcriptional regulator, transcriptional repressor for nem operon
MMDVIQSYMMTIMNGGFIKMCYPAEETAATHELIVKEASRLFCERGFESVTVGEVTNAAGLTHGAFYAHFASKQELQEAAVAYGQKVSRNLAQSHGATKKGRRAFAELYLAGRHRDNPGYGCTMAALGPEVARSTPELKATLQKGLEEILAASGGDREDAIFQTAALLARIVLARAIKDPQLSDEILESVREKLNRR